MWRHASGPAHAPHDAPAPAAATPGKRALTDALVQRRGDGEEAPAAVHAAAARGVAAPAGPLPFGQTIQRLFGRHDVSGVQAHTGPAAEASARAIGAAAYATGDHVVLGGAADLHTVAHEAAHVVQQRAGVHLKGGVGAVGDAHEHHADAVADRVVRGESAEDLLDGYRGAGAAATVQRKWVDKRLVDEQYQARWEQQKGDVEQRADGWYYEVEGAWFPVDGGSSTSSKHKRKQDKDSGSRWSDDDSPKKEDRGKKKKEDRNKHAPKTLAYGAKTVVPNDETVTGALALLEKSDIGRDVMERALQLSEHLDIVLLKDTQTRLDYDGDRGHKDTIELSSTRKITGGVGSVAQQLVMELCNLSNKVRFWETDYDAQQGELDQATYVERNERIEYDATLLVHQAWTAAQSTPEKSAWGKSNHKHPELLESWAKWWDHMQKHNQTHLEVYRQGWTRLQQSSAPRIPVPESRKVKTPVPKTKPKTNSSLASLLAYSDDEGSPEPEDQNEGEGEGEGTLKLVDY